MSALQTQFLGIMMRNFMRKNEAVSQAEIEKLQTQMNEYRIKIFAQIQQIIKKLFHN